MNENPSSERNSSDKGPERRVKSVNFTEPDVFDFAMGRADNLFGGNFSAYVMALIERDRSLGESRRLLYDLESQIMEIIKPFGGGDAAAQDPFDFSVPALKLVIVAKSRFPRERQVEYRMLSAIQKVSITTPENRIALVFPESLGATEKERFRQFETAGIDGLRVCDTAELKRYLTILADPSTSELEQSLRLQEDGGEMLKNDTKSGRNA